MKAPIQHTNVGEYTFEEQRLETFKVWPFNEDSQCNARKMAEAGFVFCGSENEPDLAQCQVCLKKLNGWEKDDDPWYVGFCFRNLTGRKSRSEHRKHAPLCLFVKIGKKDADLTAYNHLDLSLERTKNVMKAEHAEHRANLVELAAEVKKNIIKLRKLKK